ncbi:MAG TPA: glycosyltransferase [Prolixibacteraceae bacterium]|nr:glycosyltransferase [Prolixibacteraceae bacterium]
MTKITVITSLYNCTKYLAGYFEAVEKIVNKEECEFLLLHNAPNKSEIEIISKNIEGKLWFRHIIIEDREGLYSTWNRAISIAVGKYCAVWNVDDVRFPNSLNLQAEVLDNNEKCGLVTGHINGTDVYGEMGSKFYKHDRMVKHPEESYRSCLVGCFPMWRKSIHKTIGYFDEQFKCVSDFDFQIRVALQYEFYCVDHSLGIYLENDPNKISSNEVQTLENNIIYLRYKIWDKLILTTFSSTKKQFKKNTIINFGKELNVIPSKNVNIYHRITYILMAIKNTVVFFMKSTIKSI